MFIKKGLLLFPLLLWPSMLFVGSDILKYLGLVRFGGWIYFTSFVYYGGCVFILVSGWLKRNESKRRIWLGCAAAILIPVWGFFWNVHTFGCTGNMNSLGMAFRLYIEDHNGYLPEAERWVDEIYPYLWVKDRSVFRCPSDLGWGRSSYAMNANLSGKKYEEVGLKSLKVLIYETTQTGDNPSGVGKDLLEKKRHIWPRPGAKFRFNNYLTADLSLNIPENKEDEEELLY